MRSLIAGPPQGNEAGGFKQDYRARVGTVINVENMNISTEVGIPFELGAKRLSPKSELVLTFIDRSPQFFELSERLDVITSSRGRGPLLVLLRGCPHDLHGGFVLRCAFKEFVERYGSSGSWTYLKRLRWPQGASSIDAVLRSVGEGLGLPSGASVVEVLSYLKSTNQHVCFSHLVDYEDWAIDEGRLIRSWVEYFSGQSLMRDDGRLVVAFLCIQLGVERTKACVALEEFLESMRVQNIDLHAPVLVSSPLKMIRQRDLEDWLGDAARYLKDDLLEVRLLEMPSKLFQDEKPQYLRDVHARVRESLIQNLAEGPHFVQEAQ